MSFNFQGLPDITTLKEVQQKVFADMAASHGLTLEEVIPMLEAYRHQVTEITEKYKRAHQQSVMRLDAAMREAASRRRKSNDS